MKYLGEGLFWVSICFGLATCHGIDVYKELELRKIELQQKCITKEEN